MLFLNSFFIESLPKEFSHNTFVGDYYWKKEFKKLNPIEKEFRAEISSPHQHALGHFSKD